jgi:hypothetical protein
VRRQVRFRYRGLDSELIGFDRRTIEVVTRLVGRLLLAGVAALAAVVAVHAAAAPTVGVPLLAYRSGELMELEPLSLQPIRSAHVPVPQVTVSWSFDPTRQVVVLGGLERLALFDLDAWRTRLSVRLPGYIVATSWSRDRLVALVDEAPGFLESVTLDPRTGRVLQRHRVAREVEAAAAYRGGIVAITAPAGAIGPARVVVFAAGAAPRTVGLGGIIAGESGNRFVVPALSILESAGRAFVVGTNGTLATVDLGRGTVAFRRTRQLSAAEKGIRASVRHAVWLGEGRLAVSGWTNQNRAVGLTLLNVRSGRLRVLDTSADSMSAGDGVLVGYRFSFPPARGLPGGGVSVYSASGRRRFHVLGNSTIAAAEVVGARVYVDQDELHVLVIDSRTGRTLATAPGELPELLTGVPSWSRVQ